MILVIRYGTDGTVKLTVPVHTYDLSKENVVRPSCKICKSHSTKYCSVCTGFKLGNVQT
jgi:hypothetical protein